MNPRERLFGLAARRCALLLLHAHASKSHVSEPCPSPRSAGEPRRGPALCWPRLAAVGHHATPTLAKPAVAFLAAALLLAALAPAEVARASITDWSVDSSESFVRLTIPDSNLTLPGFGGATIRVRNQTSTSAWTDAGGRLAMLGGTVSSNYDDGVSIDFLSGQHNLFALEQTLLRPDPAQFTGPPDAENPNGTYVGTGTAPAAYGGRFRETTLLPLEVGYFAIRSVIWDLGGTSIGLDGSGLFGGGTSDFGIDTALLDVDGMSLPGGIGQVLPDVLHEPFGGILSTNASGGRIENLGGALRKLTYTINVPLGLSVNGIAIPGTMNGLIVAYATVPEPGSLVLLACGGGCAAAAAWRRRRGGS